MSGEQASEGHIVIGGGFKEGWLKVGVSARTVERRLNKINEGRTLYLQGTPNLRLFAGVSCVFIVFCSDEKEKRVVDHTILSKAKRIEIVSTSSRQCSTFVARFDDLAEADDLTDWIGSLNGVQIGEFALTCVLNKILFK